MFSSYITWYLFLAGAGSGAFAICAALDLADEAGARWPQRFRGVTRIGFLAGPIIVALSLLFLVFDLGSPERAFTIFTNGQPSMLTFGAWMILLFVLCGGCHFALGYLVEADVAPGLSVGIEVVGLLAACAVMTYTGLFLSDMQGIPFYHTWLLPVLFVLSSLSTGTAVVILGAFLSQEQKNVPVGLFALPRIDAILIVGECAALAAFVGLALSTGDGSDAGIVGSTASDSARFLLFGDAGSVFWLGLVVVGLGVPLLLELGVRSSSPTGSLAACAICVLVGGFCLRYVVLAAGAHVSEVAVLMALM